jgi:hypothetical protein
MLLHPHDSISPRPQAQDDLSKLSDLFAQVCLKNWIRELKSRRRRHEALAFSSELYWGAGGSGRSKRVAVVRCTLGFRVLCAQRHRPFERLDSCCEQLYRKQHKKPVHKGQTQSMYTVALTTGGDVGTMGRS